MGNVLMTVTKASSLHLDHTGTDQQKGSRRPSRLKPIAPIAIIWKFILNMSHVVLQHKRFPASARQTYLVAEIRDVVGRRKKRVPTCSVSRKHNEGGDHAMRL